MSDSSAKYYQKTKERFQKKLVKSIQIFLKKRKAKSKNMFVNNGKIFLRVKIKVWLSIEKNIMKYGEIDLLQK